MPTKEPDADDSAVHSPAKSEGSERAEEASEH